MRVCILFCFLTLGLGCFSQSFGVDTNEITFYGHPDSLEFNDGFIVQNYSGQYLSMAWQRSAETLPVGWQASICDGVACRPPEIDFALYELDTAWNSALNIMHMYYYPNGVSGTATTMLKVFQWDTTVSDTLYLTFHGVAIGSLNVEGTPEVHIKAYPNPAVDMVQLDLPQEVQVRSVRLMDMRGIQVPVNYSKTPAGLKVRVHDLVHGRYILRLEHDQGVIIVPLIKE